MFRRLLTRNHKRMNGFRARDPKKNNNTTFIVVIMVALAASLAMGIVSGNIVFP